MSHAYISSSIGRGHRQAGPEVHLGEMHTGIADATPKSGSVLVWPSTSMT